MRFPRFSHGDTEKLNGTVRIESFSDAVIAIIATLLIIEVHVPDLKGPDAISVVIALIDTIPMLISYAFSFGTLCIFWVNHHHFYHRLTHADWPLLWHNCHLLFWLALVPFTTAFVGRYPEVPTVLAIYAFVMCMGALSFRLMIRHAFFHSDLVERGIDYPERCPTVPAHALRRAPVRIRHRAAVRLDSSGMGRAALRPDFLLRAADSAASTYRCITQRALRRGLRRYRK